MEAALADFLRHCRLERRLAGLTCSAYERDVRACLAFLCQQGIDDLYTVTSSARPRYATNSWHHVLQRISKSRRAR
jgi:site-specific recombinase XerD